jgi:N-acetyl-anhydromuramyl-L-alanine amidase AmpD
LSIAGVHRESIFGAELPSNLQDTFRNLVDFQGAAYNVGMNIPSLLPGNFTVGRAGLQPKAIVIHVTTASTAQSTLAWFQNPASEVSAHYLVDKDGARIWQLVKEEDTAWHAGTYLQQRLDLNRTRPELNWVTPNVSTNLVTIGIEHVGLEHDPWSSGLYQSSAQLVAQIASRWHIPLDRAHVVGHREIFPPHAGCPGTCDLNQLVEMAKDVR